MRKLLFTLILILSVGASMSQSVQFSQGDKKKTLAYNGGVYIHGLTYLGRAKDTTVAAILEMTSNAINVPTREGALLYDSTKEKVFLYRGATLKFIEIDQVILKEATINFGSVAAQTSADSTVSIPGAVVGNNVTVSVETAAVNVANTSYTAFVSATDVVTIRLNNYSSSAKDPASGVFRILVHKN